MSRLIRVGLAAAAVAAVAVPATSHAYTCSPRGVEEKTYTVEGHSVDAYGVKWIC